MIKNFAVRIEHGEKKGIKVSDGFFGEGSRITTSANRCVLFNVLTNSGELEIASVTSPASASITNKKVTISDISAINSGTTIEVVVRSKASANYKETTKTFTLKITNKPLTGGKVVVTGNNIVGNTLTASITQDTTPKGNYTYQWYRGNSKISGATGSNYELTAEDSGSIIKVIVTASKTNYEGISFEDTTDVSNNKTDVVKTGVTKPTNAICNTLTYNGDSQSLASIPTADRLKYGLINNDKVDAGSQTVTARLNDGYIWSNGDVNDVTISCSISPRAVTIKASNQSKTYDGTALSANTTCEVTSGSLAKTSHSLSCTASGSITDAGNATGR